MKKFIIGLLVMTVFSSTAFAELIIIVNKDVPENTLSHKDIQNIFLCKRVHWNNHSKIRFATVRDAEVHSIFLKEYVKLSEANWKIYWKRMIFIGRGLPPKNIATEAELIGYVSKTAGAIGYVLSDGISKKPGNEDVKIINVK